MRWAYISQQTKKTGEKTDIFQRLAGFASHKLDQMKLYKELLHVFIFRWPFGRLLFNSLSICVLRARIAEVLCFPVTRFNPNREPLNLQISQANPRVGALEKENSDPRQKPAGSAKGGMTISAPSPGPQHRGPWISFLFFSRRTP